jgi:hypothetical protein
MFVPHPSSLSSPINILQYPQAVGFPRSSEFESSGNLHEQFGLNIGLWISEHEVDLSRGPAVYEGHREKESDRGPLDHRAVSLPIMYVFDLFAAMNVESSLPFVNFSRVNMSFALHGPNRWENNCAVRDL